MSTRLGLSYKNRKQVRKCKHPNSLITVEASRRIGNLFVSLIDWSCDLCGNTGKGSIGFDYKDMFISEFRGLPASIREQIRNDYRKVE